VSTPYTLDPNVLMGGQCLSLLEVQTIHNCDKVCIPFLDVTVTGSKVCGQEAEASVIIIQSDSNTTFVSGHAT